MKITDNKEIKPNTIYKVTGKYLQLGNNYIIKIIKIENDRLFYQILLADEINQPSYNILGTHKMILKANEPLIWPSFDTEEL